MNVRHHEKYYVKKYKTERCKNTSVPYFQTLMNKYVKEQKVMFSKLLKSHSRLYVSSESYPTVSFSKDVFSQEAVNWVFLGLFH